MPRSGVGSYERGQGRASATGEVTSGAAARAASRGARAALWPLALALGGLAGGLGSGLAGCASEEIVPIRIASGEVVPLAYRVDVVAETAEGARLPGAAVFLRNDEDAVGQVAWTDDEGRASLAQVYLTGNVVETQRTVGPDEVHIRFPHFQLRAARAGFLPTEVAFTSEPFGATLETNASALYVETPSPRVVVLAPVAGATVPAVRHAGALFSSPPGSEVRVGVRQPAYADRFLRLSPEAAPRLEACARAYLGKQGEEVIVLVRPPLASPGYFTAMRRLADTCDVVITTGPYGYPIAEGLDPALLGALTRRVRLVADAPAPPKGWRKVDLLRARIDELLLAGGAPTERWFAPTLERWAELERSEEAQAAYPELLLAFALDAEQSPPALAEARAQIIVRAVLVEARRRKRTAVVVGSDLGRALDRELLAQGQRRLAEAWLEAWPAR